jgi:hypothetical protein
MTSGNSKDEGLSSSEMARRQRRAVRDSKRNMRKLHHETVVKLARPGIEGHKIGCDCDGCDRLRHPEYWAERDAWQTTHPGQDWYLRDMNNPG